MFSDEYLFYFITFFIIIMSLPTFILCRSVASPYGRHYKSAEASRTISPPLAWFLMESPTLWVTFLLFPFGKHHSNPLAYVLMSPFLFHYIHRIIIYPIKLHFTSTHQKTTNRFPVSVAMAAFTYNIMNGYIQSRWVSHYASFENGNEFWLRFGGGLLIFAVGMLMNVWGDGVLMGLKSQGGGYKIPRGGLFEYVSSPNYLGEILEWLGWAFMTWSWSGLAFFLYTCAILIPRAVSNHNWYLDKFGEDYPRTRKTVFPFLY